MHLSPCELEVVRAFVQGQRLTDIARARGVSLKTVEAQKASAAKKLGVPPKSSQVAFADVARAHLNSLTTPPAIPSTGDSDPAPAKEAPGFSEVSQ